MKWEPHPTDARYIRLANYVSYNVLVRVEKMAKGYLWTSKAHYGYAQSIEEAKAEAEEVLLIQIIR